MKTGVLNYKYTIYLMVIFLTAFFILQGSYLPMIDLPQHMAQITELNNILHGNSKWNEFLVLNFNTPYLTCYLSLLLLTQFFEIVLASRIFVAICFLFFIYSVYKFNKISDGSYLVLWIAIPSFFGFAYYWGFISFLLAIPIGIIFFIENIKLARDLKLINFICVIFLGVVLFYSHILSFLFFCLLSLVFIYFELRNKIDVFKVLPIYIFFSLLVVLYLSQKDMLGVLYIQDTRMHFESFTKHLKNLLVYPFDIGDKRFRYISIMLILAPWFMGYGVSKNYKKFIPITVFLVVWFILPTGAHSTALVYERYALLFFIFYYLIFEKKEDIKYIKSQLFFKLIFFICLSVLMINNINNIIQFKKENQDFVEIIENVPSEKRALGLIFDRNSNTLSLPRVYLHMPAWYQAQKNGWYDFSFAWFHPQIVRFNPKNAPEVKPGFEWTPSDLLKLKNCMVYDLIIVRSDDKSALDIISNSKCSNQRLILNKGSWYIFESTSDESNK